MVQETASGTRCVAIVGPYLSGKTSLLEAMLFEAGAIPRRGNIKNGTTVGDSSQEARERSMSVEVNVADASYLGDSWTFLDCPGSVEFQQDARAALAVADAAIVVCEPEASKVAMLVPTLKFIDEHNVPAILFINKFDVSSETARELMAALQEVAIRPLVLRQIPIRGEDGSTGYVDLASERAYEYTPGEQSRLIEVPSSVEDRNEEARQELLESLADFDDEFLEQLLEDIVPPTEEVYRHLARDMSEGLIMPVLLGSAEQASGVKRLFKALRHEAPGVEATLGRKSSVPDDELLLQVFKTRHLLHSGKFSIARVWRGEVKDGMTFGPSRISGLHRMTAGQMQKESEASSGDVVAMGRMEKVQTGHTLSTEGIGQTMDWPAPVAPVYSTVVLPDKWEDEAKLSEAIARLIEEDPSISRGFNELSRENVVWGQGNTHIQVMAQMLKNRFNTSVRLQTPATGYQETVKKKVQHRARHKKQSGGHGEFGDVHLEIRPMPRGTGVEFTDTISGGVVPKQYIPAVEAGVREYCAEGPLGFPVTDIAINLFDGKYHAVDSSDWAFRKAGVLAMKEALPECSPVLLEPICSVRVFVPTQHTSNAQGIVSRRRGQILGFAPKEGWTGWDEVETYMPQSELHDLIIELRSQTMGLGTYAWEFAHMAELTGRLADTVVEQRRANKK